MVVLNWDIVTISIWSKYQTNFSVTDENTSVFWDSAKACLYRPATSINDSCTQSSVTRAWKQMDVKFYVTANLWSGTFKSVVLYWLCKGSNNVSVACLTHCYVSQRYKLDCMPWNWLNLCRYNFGCLLWLHCHQNLFLQFYVWYCL